MPKPSALRMRRRATPNLTRASPPNSCSTRTVCWRRRLSNELNRQFNAGRADAFGRRGKIPRRLGEIEKCHGRRNGTGIFPHGTTGSVVAALYHNGRGRRAGGYRGQSAFRRDQWRGVAGGRLVRALDCLTDELVELVMAFGYIRWVDSGAAHPGNNVFRALKWWPKVVS